MSNLVFKMLASSFLIFVPVAFGKLYLSPPWKIGPVCYTFWTRYSSNLQIQIVYRYASNGSGCGPKF